ncbi:MAG: D-glycero-beta-D-manno-heptose 1,7-bisphosphate 7-phosphatase [Campylobacterota bacterium]|nr:D-glycero-beta-D-manno-heptose 1,7-bisphosphate 7-phosphatase [Campylobacterota bacterium]
MEKVVFLDRDGVINIEKNYLYKIEDFEFIDGVFESLKYLQNLDYKLIIITNQSGIGRGYYTLEQYNKLTTWMIEQFNSNDIVISSVFCCPHEPNSNCDCRKPKTGMIEQSQKIFDIDFANSWLIGDKDSDIQTAYNANIPNTIQVQSGHIFDKKDSKAKYITNSIKDIDTIIKI